MRAALPFLLARSACALTVAVTGATGRTGRLVVEALLRAGHEVTALVRDEGRAAEVLPPSVSCHVLDLATASGDAMRTAYNGADKLIWCASGFTESGESIDVRGMAELAPSAFASATDDVPAVVMLSSAGVTRLGWGAAKQERLVGASDIPIVRLNPGGILGLKAEAEQLLRDSGVPYCVVRPTGLKFEGWPAGRPVLSQGDVAVGRCNARDLADVLVRVLGEPAATGKTFEMFTLAGYPAPTAIAPVLERLALDSAGPLPEPAVGAFYDALQQLLPGEEQDATKLEIGRTYEQIDQGDVAPRERGAAPTRRELNLAASISGGQQRGGLRGWARKLLRR